MPHKSNVCVYELKYLTIQLLYSKEAVLSVVNLVLIQACQSSCCSICTFWQTFAVPGGSVLLRGLNGAFDTISP